MDFHHKVAYRFERAYRITKKQPEKKQQLNLDIIEVISEHSEFIEMDNIALYFCLYFCIFYNNPELVEFLRTLIKKMRIDHPGINRLLELIDVNGVQRLRTVGEQINAQVYHLVLYEAYNNRLRIIYTQITRQLKFI